MKTISLTLDGRSSSLAAPALAAAWSMAYSKDGTRATILFRLKRVQDPTAYSSLLLVRQEVPDLSWKSVGWNPTAENTGGVEAKDPYFVKVELFKNNQDVWVIKNTPGIGEYALTQRDLANSSPKISPEMRASLADIATTLKQYAAQPKK